MGRRFELSRESLPKPKPSTASRNIICGIVAGILVTVGLASYGYANHNASETAPRTSNVNPVPMPLQTRSAHPTVPPSQAPSAAPTAKLTRDPCAVAAAIKLRSRPSLAPCPIGNLWQLRAAPAPVIDCSAHGLRRRQQPATIVDAMLLSTEADILALRLLELDGVVDTFVILESRESISGRQRPVLWDTHEACFQRWSRRIVHRTVREVKVGGVWNRESMLRNYLSVLGAEAVADACQPHVLQPSHDNVLFAVSDVDEVPRAETYAVMKQCEGFKWPVAPIQDRFFYYSFNWRKRTDWTFGPGIIPWSQVDAFLPQSTRAMPARSSEAVFQRGGWHMSYFMSVADIVSKLSYYAHAEMNRAPFNKPQWVEESLRTGRDLFGRTGGEELEFNNCSSPDADIPQAVQLNREFFAHFCPLDMRGPG